VWRLNAGDALGKSCPVAPRRAVVDSHFRPRLLMHARYLLRMVQRKCAPKARSYRSRTVRVNRTALVCTASRRGWNVRNVWRDITRLQRAFIGCWRYLSGVSDQRFDHHVKGETEEPRFAGSKALASDGGHVRQSSPREKNSLLIVALSHVAHPSLNFREWPSGECTWHFCESHLSPALILVYTFALRNASTLTSD